MKQNTKNNGFRKFTIFVFALILIFFVFISGFFLGVWHSTGGKLDLSLNNIISQAPNYLSDSKSQTDLFWQVWQSIQSKYVGRPVDQKTLYYGAVKGLVESLNDPYSVFMDPTVTTDFNNELSGEFEGIGAEIGIKENQLTIIAPLPGSPAEKAGLKAGDKILKIDDKDTSSMDIDYATSIIRGKKGTKVTLTILRTGMENPQPITVTRDQIKVNSVTWKMEKNNIANIQITYFNSDTSALFKKAVNEILTQSPKGIILDLRNDPGGYLSAATDVLNYFIENKTLVIEDLGKGEKQEIKSSDNAPLKGIKTVVLVDEGSASASEIVAGALQDYKIAKLVGQKTFGKGTVQDLQQFNDGSSLKITIARWLTPLGRSIDKAGITPDYVVELTQQDYNQNKDPQLDKAMELLSSSQ